MIRAILLIGAGAVALAGCATVDHSDVRAEAAATLANAPALAANTNAVDVVGTTAYTWGDRWTATNLFERAANARDDVTRRYNLAVGYESTGRLAQAADLYQSVAADGEFTTAVTTRPGGNGTRHYRANLSDLAVAGLGRVQARMAYAPGSGAVAAGGLGTPAAAVVGATPAIADDEAMRRDAQENPIR